MPSPWTPEDRARLFAWVEQNGAGNWTQAATQIPGRSAKQCRDQWVQILAPMIKRLCNLPSVPKSKKNVKMEH
ncbi:hypothetical protein BD324DRAFT_653608 [Kockovaella imperatae]|uniref:Uncharacterized protein n=1 Tax=Kockovaella imperatae TaxID=4999 RepID=A0A1Y1U7A7_9TREE|nr:hypothetical protein BD324DRAFT_653608 [Kockovaella imperatae]ORX33910.1 hypothetical protein BD324DRAFT_653608 [Kockovaella imperatae]